jgi:hypothetical protein
LDCLRTQNRAETWNNGIEVNHIITKTHESSTWGFGVLKSV